MSETTQRPPLGAAPFYIQASIRIGELGETIHNYCATEELDKIKEWASEIILQCDLIKEMRRINKEDCLKEVERAQQEKRREHTSCETCKHKFRLETERPCSLCKHNFVDKFEREEE